MEKQKVVDQAFNADSVRREALQEFKTATKKPRKDRQIGTPEEEIHKRIVESHQKELAIVAAQELRLQQMRHIEEQAPSRGEVVAKQVAVSAASAGITSVIAASTGVGFIGGTAISVGVSTVLGQATGVKTPSVLLSAGTGGLGATGIKAGTAGIAGLVGSTATKALASQATTETAQVLLSASGSAATAGAITLAQNPETQKEVKKVAKTAKKIIPG